MPFVEQTPDEICRALGLSGFCTNWTRSSPRQEMRLLLEPTFHPELCIVFAEGDRGVTAKVACAREKIPFDVPAPTPVDEDEGIIGTTALADLEIRFRNALQTNDRLTQGRDGIRVNIFWRTFNARLIVEGAAPEPADALGRFVAQVIELASHSIRSAACKACLREASAYLRAP